MSAYSQQSRNVSKSWILLFLFVGIVSGLCYVFGVLHDQPLLGVIGLVISLGQAFFAYFFGDKMALMVAGAQKVTYDQAPQLFEMVQNLSKIAQIPVPKIHISPDKSANAFACGRDPKHASICINQGLLDILSKPELEGVIAHELSHVKNRDTLVMTITTVLASTVSFLTDWGFRVLAWNRNDGEKDNKSPILLGLYIVAIVLAPVISVLIQMAISRQREFLADATGVTLTRYPKGLIDALTKISNSPVPSNHYSTATNHLYICPPKKTFAERVQFAFSTHPSLEDRVQALKAM